MTINAPLYSAAGKNLGNQPLPVKIFGTKVNEVLMAQALRSYTFRQRQNTKKVKTRGEVSFTTAKMWRQKGTGRARHGSRRAPIFVGGGVAHGPTGLENYKLSLSKKMRISSLKSALSLHAQNHTIVLVEELESLSGKTGSMLKLINKIFSDSKTTPKTLLVLDSPLEPVLQAVRNLEVISPTQVKRLNIYEVINHRRLIITKKSLEYLTEKLI